jgi:hypothetical protein
MPSVKSAIETALARKKVPPFMPGSTHDLAMKLGLSPPVSTQGLLGALDMLPAASRTYQSERLISGYVHGSATLFLQSDGATAFSGQVHESGVVGDHFVMAVALLDVRDANGNTPVFVHKDTVVGQLQIGFSDKNWNDYGGSAVIRDNWEAVRTSRIQTVLKTQTDPWQVTELVIAGLFIAVGLAIGGIFVVQSVKQCQESGQWKCGWVVTGGGPGGPMTPGDPSHPPNGGMGVEYQ